MTNRVLRALAFVGFGLACAAAGMPFAKCVPSFLVPDDGFFYAQIAFNLAHLHRSTFDGIHTTSGYHLPWGFVLAAVSAAVGLFSSAKAVHLFAYLATSFTLIGWTAHHFFRSWPGRIAAFVLLTTHFSLTEMALAAPLLLALLRESSPEPRIRKNHVELALAFALALVRVDLACVPIVLAITHPERSRGLRLAAATVAGVLVQLAWMKLMFGQFFSVAAELKTDGALRAISWHIPYNLFPSVFVFLTYAAQVVMGALALKLRPTRATLRLVFASLSFLVFHVMLSIVRPWYMTPGWIMMAFVLERALEAASRPERWRIASNAVFWLVSIAFVVHSVRAELFYREDQIAAAAAVEDLQRIVPPQTALFTFDNPGYLGFFSGLRVVDGDGLVNDYAYAKRLRAHTLAGYLDEERICWVVTDFAGQHPQLSIGGLIVEASEMTLFTQHNRGHLADFLLYRLKTERCADSTTSVELKP